MAAQGRNDARGAARLLAVVAKDCIRDPAIASEREVPLNNVYRLLEAFRANAFFGAQQPPRPQHQGTAKSLTLMRPVERNVEEVRSALENAMHNSFAGRPKDEAIKIIEDVLRAITYPENFGEPSADNRKNTAHFFDCLLDNLKFT